MATGALATDVLEAFSGAGVTEFCVCAGARNVSLVVGLERSIPSRFFDEVMPSRVKPALCLPNVRVAALLATQAM